MTIHPGNFDCFMEVYEEKLAEAVKNHPKEYGWPIENVPQVVARMRISIAGGTYNKNGHAFKATCKELNIPYTYKGINQFITL